VFDKDTGAKSIRELPEKLEFAVQVLTSTKDLDLDINHNALSNDPQAANKIAAIWTALGYLDRPGLLAGRNVLAPWEVVAASYFFNSAEPVDSVCFLKSLRQAL
ncbi:MAG: hypothetical protein HQL19_01480, partial [Candidatus Omnitrophica bacterium]|nr:hypothetical protein [Candidatus Omnitrophota bacterium]